MADELLIRNVRPPGGEALAAAVLAHHGSPTRTGRPEVSAGP